MEDAGAGRAPFRGFALPRARFAFPLDLLTEMNDD